MARVSSISQEALLIIEILKLIPRNRLITASEIRNSLFSAGYDIPIRTLQRYLKSISETESLHVECDSRSKPYGYRRSSPKSEFADLKLTPEESLLLSLAGQYLQYLLPTTISTSLSQVFDAARDQLFSHPAATPAASWLNKVALVFTSIPTLPPEIKPRIFSIATEGLYRNRKLVINYSNKNGKQKVSVVSPIALVQQDLRIYLVCRYDGYEDLRNLALHRIMDIRLLDIEADRPKDFRLADYIRHSNFNFGTGKKCRLEIAFRSPVLALNLKETPFNREQKLEKDADGVFHLDVVLDDTTQIDGWIALWKDNAEFLEIRRTPIQDPAAVKMAGNQPPDGI